MERWIAASATSDDAVEEYAQPHESPQVSAPAASLPAIAQDLLDAVGLSPGDPHTPHDLVACFHGARRTGKTLAAHVLGQALSLDVLRIDLAAVSSKYIGETEKNLAAVFDAAERAGQVLLIDEADALFGKRTEVNDAHDRYANIDVNYLLQRIEQFNGLVIVATNLPDDIEAPFSSAVQHRWRAVRFPRTLD